MNDAQDVFASLGDEQTESTTDPEFGREH
jgi:hypothetical protein